MEKSDKECQEHSTFISLVCYTKSCLKQASSTSEAGFCLGSKMKQMTSEKSLSALSAHRRQQLGKPELKNPLLLRTNWARKGGR